MYHVLCKRSKMDICFLVLLIFIMCKKSEVRIKKKKTKKIKVKHNIDFNGCKYVSLILSWKQLHM